MLCAVLCGMMLGGLLCVWYNVSCVVRFAFCVS